MKNRASRILIAAGVLSLLVNIIFFFTYPINVGQSDNPNYLAMIITGTSNLIHASGYPAILYFLTHPFLPPVLLPLPHGLPSDISADWFNALQRAQLLLHAALFLLSILLCVKVFSKSVAAILTIGWGCNVLFMGNVNATAPEWFQADALILSLLMHAYARTLTTRKKVLVYCFASAVFGIAYLIKYNSLLFAISLLAFLLLDKESLRFKVLQALCSVAIFLLLTSAYAAFYHQKSTGTKQLSFDHAWIMIGALPPDYLSGRPEELGVNSLRWAALVSITPQEYFRAQAIENINYGPPKDTRQRYREQLESIFRMSKAELIQYVKAHPLPTNYNYGTAAVPLYYYYGVEKIDALGIDVYVESVRSHLWNYLKRIAVALASLFVSGPSIHAVPTFANPLGYNFLLPNFNARFSGALKIVPPSDANPYFLPYYNPSETLSFYGVKLIEKLDAFSSASFVYIALNMISLLGLFRLKSAFDKMAVFCMLAGLLLFVSGSAMLLGMRTKELITITPVYFCFLSIGLPSACQWLAEAIVHKRGRGVTVTSRAKGRPATLQALRPKRR